MQNFPELALKNVPAQRASPIYAKIENQKIVLDEGATLHPLLQKDALQNARVHLKHQLEDLASVLDDSNVDKRFVRAFKQLSLLVVFEDDAGVINLGLQTNLIIAMTKGLESEISEVLSLQISSTLTNVSHYASQYKDWVDFTRNARDYPARNAIETEIDKAIENLERTLSSSSEVVDAKIPASFVLIGQLLKGDANDRRNAMYASIRGFENICIAASKYAYEQAVAYLQDAGAKARPTLVKIGAALIVALSLSIVADFMPVITKAPELHWILENLPQLEKISRILK